MFYKINYCLFFLFCLAVCPAFAQDDDDRYDDYDDAFIFDQVVPVAEEEPAYVEEAAPVDDTLTPDERLSREFERYRRLVDEGAMDAADVSAKRIVELVIRIHGPISLETSKALNNLALVQHRNGQYDAAIQNFESAVEIIEDR